MAVKQWERSLVALVEQRGPALSRYAYLLCGDSTEAADLVQEALLRTFGRLRTSTHIDTLEGYVRQAILHVYVDGRRRQSRWARLRHLLAGQATQESAEQAVVEREGIRSGLAGLSPRQRACVVLRYYDQLTVPQIAARLNCAEGSVKRHLSDALARLARQLDAPEGRDAHER